MIAKEISRDATNVLAASDEEQLMEAFGQFLQMEVANGSATDDTVQGYQREARLWIHWCREIKLNPLAARRAHIIRYRDFLKSKGIAVTTRKMKVSIVRRFYDAAVKHDLINGNPAAGVRGGIDPTLAEDRLKSLTGAALSLLVQNIPVDTLAGQRDRAIVGLMALHGLRRVEVHRLNQTDVQLDDDLAFLNVWGKGDRRRRVYLRPDTYSAISIYMNAKAAVGLPLDALFLAHDNRARGQRISRRGLNLVIDKYLRGNALKHPGVSCHALRHTHGTLAIAGGAQVEQLRDSMGHSDIATTSIYVKAISRKRNNPANFIDVEL